MSADLRVVRSVIRDLLEQDPNPLSPDAYRALTVAERELEKDMRWGT